MALVIGQDPRTGKILTYRESLDNAVGDAYGGEDIAFDAQGVDTLIGRIQDVIDLKVVKAGRRARDLDRISDANDNVSRGFVRDVQDFRSRYDEWNSKYVAELENLIKDLRTVKAEYLAREDEIGERFRKGMSD